LKKGGCVSGPFFIADFGLQIFDRRFAIEECGFDFGGNRNINELTLKSNSHKIMLFIHHSIRSFNAF